MNESAVAAPSATKPVEMKRSLGLMSATTLVMGSMIGSGVFIVAADIARLTSSPALLIASWLVTGFLTIAAALSYGELAAMFPNAGGQYLYLRESLGRLWGFLYGWSFFTVIQCGTIAAVGVAFGKFLGVFFPLVSSEHWILRFGQVPFLHLGSLTLGGMQMGLNTQNLAAILSVLVLTGVNICGVKSGALVQNVFTTIKVISLLGLMLLGLFFCSSPQALAANFGANFWSNASLGAQHLISGSDTGSIFVSSLTVIAIAQVGSLFSADAWTMGACVAGEIKEPQRILPRSLIFGVGGVILLYIGCNLAYLTALPLVGDPDGLTTISRGIQYASEDRVAVAVIFQSFGWTGAKLMALAILIATFGCNNGLILSGARVYYAMAKDGLFFRSAAKIHPRTGAPVAALLMQALWTCLLCLSGSYSQLLDFIIFTVLLFYVLTIIGLFLLRRDRPLAERPYKAVGYPWLPALYIVAALLIDVTLLLYKPQYTWPGLFIVLLGLPVYFLWSRRAANASVA